MKKMEYGNAKGRSKENLHGNEAKKLWLEAAQFDIIFRWMI